MTLPPTSLHVMVWCGDTPVVLPSLGDRCERHKRASLRAWSARHPRRRFGFSPQRGFTWRKTRIWLRLADLSRILSGIFFWEVHPASEMGGQNGPNGLFCQNDQNDQNVLVFQNSDSWGDLGRSFCIRRTMRAGMLRSSACSNMAENLQY